MLAIPAPAYLAPDWRYAGDDWTLTFVVYEVAPAYAADGITIATPGVPQPLVGCSVTGTARYQSRSVSSLETTPPAGSIAMTGAVSDAANGLITLALTAAQTVFPRQALEDWGDPRCARLLIQPKVVDAGGNQVTVGLQPLFVF